MVERPSELSALYQRRQRARRVVSRVLRDLHERQPIRSWNTILRSRPGRDVTVTGPFVPGQRRLSTPGSSADDNVNTPDDPSFDVTEDLWVAASIAPNVWGNGTLQTWASQRQSNSGWRILVLGDGGLQFLWSDGSINRNSNVARPADFVDGERATVAVWFDSDNGSGTTSTVHWYRSDDDGEMWVEFDSTDHAGPSTIAPSGQNPKIGVDAGAANNFEGDIWWTEIRDGDMNGPLISRVDFTTAEVGATEIQDLQGHTWTLSGDTEII